MTVCYHLISVSTLYSLLCCLWTFSPFGFCRDMFELAFKFSFLEIHEYLLQMTQTKMRYIAHFRLCHLKQIFGNRMQGQIYISKKNIFSLKSFVSVSFWEVTKGRVQGWNIHFFIDNNWIIHSLALR